MFKSSQVMQIFPVFVWAQVLEFLDVDPMPMEITGSWLNVKPRGAGHTLHSHPISEGVLIMFPSWLAHSVEANPTDEERISPAFNVMFTDFTNTLAQPNWSPTSGNSSN